jgi:hypothetical protein
VRVGEIAGDIFEQDLAAEPFLHGQDALYDVVERLLGVWQGQQVMRVVAADTAPARWSEIQAGSYRVASDSSASRYASSKSVDPIDIATPCSTMGARVRARSSAASGRPPAIMKFSEITSNQSTRAVPSQSRG